MAILTQSLSPAQIAANQVRNIIRQQFMQLAQSGLAGYNLIWKNKTATPQQVVEALGTDAESVFQLANLNIQTVTAAASLGGTAAPMLPELPSDYTVTFNGDGSATVRQSSSSSSGQ